MGGREACEVPMCESMLCENAIQQVKANHNWKDQKDGGATACNTTGYGEPTPPLEHLSIMHGILACQLAILRHMSRVADNPTKSTWLKGRLSGRTDAVIKVDHGSACRISDCR